MMRQSMNRRDATKMALAGVGTAALSAVPQHTSASLVSIPHPPKSPPTLIARKLPAGAANAPQHITVASSLRNAHTASTPTEISKNNHVQLSPRCNSRNIKRSAEVGVDQCRSRSEEQLRPAEAIYSPDRRRWLNFAANFERISVPTMTAYSVILL